MIIIKKSETADSRSCDWSKVSRQQLAVSSLQHINDVQAVMAFLSSCLVKASERHDQDKLLDIDSFHSNFQTGFKTRDWLDRHYKNMRHHLQEADGVPDDVNLLDVIECIVDGVTAGLARTGNVREFKMSNDLLQKAVANTVELLKANILVEPQS